MTVERRGEACFAEAIIGGENVYLCEGSECH